MPRPPRRASLAPVLALALAGPMALVARAVHADEPPWRPRATLTVERDAGAAGCVDAKALREAVGARLGYDPIVEADREGELALTVRFTKTARGLEAVVRAKDRAGEPKGEKKLTTARGDCGELAEAVTLTITILLDPHTGLVAPPPSAPEPMPFAPPPGPSSASSSSSSPPPKAPIPAPPADTTPALTPRVRGALLGSVGAAPAPTVGARIGAGIAAARWSVDGELRADLSREATLDGNRVSSGLVLAGIVPCVRGGILEACVVGAAGSLRTESSRATPASTSSFHAAAGARVGVVVPMTRVLAFDASIDGLVALTRTSVRVDGVDVWVTPLLSGVVAAGVELRIP